MEFYEIYRPLTASPFRDRRVYREILPHPDLRPWVRCFWEFRGGAGDTLVTPDSCMDVIFDLEEGGKGLFCGVDDVTVWEAGRPDGGAEQFAIRFYPWAAALFAEESLREARNLRCDAGAYFPAMLGQLHRRLAVAPTLEQRAAAAQAWLLEWLDVGRASGDMLQGAWEIVKSRGGVRMEALSRSLHISRRQLERLFREQMGIGPKKLSGLVRYQNLWRDVLFQRDFNIHDAVARYGYTDQAHLLKDFRKYHLMSPADARAFAYGNSSLFYKTDGGRL